MDLITYDPETCEVNLKVPGKKWIFTPVFLIPLPNTEDYDPDNIPEQMLLTECSSQKCYLHRLCNSLRRDLTFDIVKKLPKTGVLTIVSLFPGNLGFEAGLLYELGDRDVNLYLIGFPEGDEFKQLLTSPEILKTSSHPSGRPLTEQYIKKRKTWFRTNVRRLKALKSLFPQTRVFICDQSDNLPKADALLMVDFLDECTPREMMDEKYVKETFFDRYANETTIIGVAFNDFPLGAGTLVRVNGKDTKKFMKQNRKMVWYYLIRDTIVTVWLILVASLRSLTSNLLSH